MANEIVKYHNDFASVAVSFTPMEQNMFAAVIYECRGKGTKKHYVSLNYLRELSGFSSKDNARFMACVKEFAAKMHSMFYMEDKEDGGFKSFNLFPTFETVDMKTKDPKLEIAVHEDYAYIINIDPEFLPDKTWSLLNAGYTSFELAQHNALKSSYSKNAFRQLKRFKRTGWWEVSIEEFRRLMDIPEKYRMSDIRKRVIGPIKEELPQYFENLSIKEKKGGATGRQVLSLKFRFKPQLDKGIWHDDEIYGELREEYSCPACGKPLYAIIKKSGDVFYGHKGGWKADAPCRQTFGSLKEILRQNGKTIDPEAEKKPYKENSKPKIEKTGFRCSECGEPLFKLYNEKGEMFYGHIDGWKKDAACRKTYSSIAEIRGYSENPTRSDYADYELTEKTDSGDPADVYSIFETVKNDMASKE